MQTPLTTRPSVQAQVARVLAERAHWDRVAFELDQEFGTEAVEAAMRAAGADPDRYLAERAARRAADVAAGLEPSLPSLPDPTGCCVRCGDETPGPSYRYCVSCGRSNYAAARRGEW